MDTLAWLRHQDLLLSTALLLVALAGGAYALPDASAQSTVSALNLTVSGYQCNPSKTCNVCAACCKEHIPDGDACDKCVKDDWNAVISAIPARRATCVPHAARSTYHPRW